MEQRRRFDTTAQADAFIDGLQAANDGHIHGISRKLTRSGDYAVEWYNENKTVSELPEKHPPLTPAEYVERKGAICPVCRGSDIEGHSVDVEGNELTLEVTCNNPDCEASWVDCYELSGYDNLER